LIHTNQPKQMTRNAITAQDRAAQSRAIAAAAIAAAAIGEANRKAGTADERNLNTLLDILILPRLG
jgi:hypothetical protein